jgi:hypothetical protein
MLLPVAVLQPAAPRSAASGQGWRYQPKSYFLKAIGLEQVGQVERADVEPGLAAFPLFAAMGVLFSSSAERRRVRQAGEIE